MDNIAMSQNFTGKVVLITGSGRGVGKATALNFARLGADIVVNYLRKRTAAEETAKEIEALGCRAHIVKADVGDPDDIERLVAETEQAFGGLDILINNAASGYARPVMEQKVKGWDWTMNINARAALFLSQKAAPLMEKRGGGAIVNVMSIGNLRTLPEYVVVGASKGALEVVTRYCAVEFSPMNIVVNAVSPGVIETDALNFFTHGKMLAAEAHKHTPAGRIVTPEDVAGVIAFLCSPEACMIRGQTLIVDGGYMWTI
jgi:enoyl-[acyl-carrier protein] reductase III